MGRKENTSKRLKESFKQLAKTIPVEKITIQEIVDGAGVIRPTFYNHFQDKYQLMERIFKDEVIEPVRPLLRNDMLHEAVELIFLNILQEKEFYSKIYRMEGQNSFESILKDCLYDAIIDLTEEFAGNKVTGFKLLGHEMLAEYYSRFLALFVLAWMRDGMSVLPREMADMFDYIKDHSMYEILREME